jgi:rare lipoprotein A
VALLGIVATSLILLSACGGHKTAHQKVPPPPTVTPAQPSVADNDSAYKVPHNAKPIYVETGLASWYGPPYNHRKGANGEIYDQNAMTAAHRTLPMGSTVRVTNVATNQSVLVRVTDRGPFVPGRVLDLSMAAAKAIGVWRPGVAQVKIEAFAHATNDPAGRWCVQIGAFKSADDALDLQAELMQRYKTAKVIEFTGPTGHWVRVNPAKPDLAHANEVAQSLESPDPAALPYVVRLD